MLRSALRQSTTREALLAELASAIGPAQDRARFLREVGGRLDGPAAPAVAVAPRPAEAAALDTIRAAALPHVGPIAAVLVKRAAADGAPLEAVWQRVAAHIDDPRERATFLARRG